MTIKIIKEKEFNKFKPCVRCGGTIARGWGKHNIPICKRCYPSIVPLFLFPNNQGKRQGKMTIMQPKNKHVYSFNNGVAFYHGINDLNKQFPHGRDCLSDGTPLEDLGNYLLSDNFLSLDAAYNKFMETT